VVERCVVDGEKLGALTPGVVTVANGDGTEADAEPEQRPVGDPKRCARHLHGVQVQHCGAGPWPDGALGVFPLAAGRSDAEEEADRAEAHAQALRARCCHDVLHGWVGRGARDGARRGGRRSHEGSGAGTGGWWGEWARRRGTVAEISTRFVFFFLPPEISR
jgi:hypothetical protein